MPVDLDPAPCLWLRKSEQPSVNRRLIGIPGLSEAIRSFAAIKRAMLRQSRKSHLLIDGERDGRHNLVTVDPCLTSRRLSWTTPCRVN